MPESLSFSGCGFLMVYHLGVLAALKDNAPHLLKGYISGASAGSVVAACALLDVPAGVLLKVILPMGMKVRQKLMGPFCPSFSVNTFLKDALNEALPPDAHLRVSGKIQISVTRVYDRTNVLLTHFDTREELIIALLSSCFIPGFSGWLPYNVNNVYYIDGGFTENIPQIDEHTITISPFPGAADIAPKEDEESYNYTISLFGASLNMSMETLNRLGRIMLPPNIWEMQRICHQGYKDTCDFLIKNDIQTLSSTLSYELPEDLLAVFERVALDYPTEDSDKMEINIVWLQLANLTCHKLLNTHQDNQDSDLERKI